MTLTLMTGYGENDEFELQADAILDFSETIHLEHHKYM